MPVQIRGDFKKLVTTLERGSRAKLPRLTKPIGSALVASTRERFRSGKDPEGKPWVPLAAATIQGGFRRRDFTKKGAVRSAALRRNANRKILVQRGNLKNSISYKADGSQVAVGSNLKYARIHQLGGDAGRKSARVTIPARPYLGVSTEDEREIERLTEHFLKEVL